MSYDRPDTQIDPFTGIRSTAPNPDCKPSNIVRAGVHHMIVGEVVKKTSGIYEHEVLVQCRCGKTYQVLQSSCKLLASRDEQNTEKYNAMKGHCCSDRFCKNLSDKARERLTDGHDYPVPKY